MRLRDRFGPGSRGARRRPGRLRRGVVLGTRRARATCSPRRAARSCMPRGALGDAPSGAFLAGGIAAALFKRERTGEASVVDVSLLGAAVWTLGVDLVADHDPAASSRQAARRRASAQRHRARRDRSARRRPLAEPQHARPRPALGADVPRARARRPDRRSRATRPPSARAEHIARSCTDSSSTRIGVAAARRAQGAARRREDTIFSAIASPIEVIDDPQVRANGYMPRIPDHPTARLSSAPMQFDGSGLEIRRRAPGDRRAHRRGASARSASTRRRSHGCARLGALA